MTEMENPPKGSADWVAEQDGSEEATTYAPKGSQVWADAAPQEETVPKGSQEWGEQNTPAPTDSKPIPQTDVAPKADNPAGVSPQNDADAVMGMDQQIKLLQDTAAKYKPESDEDRKKRERKEKSQKIMAAVGDGLMALSNLYFTTKGAPNMYNHQTMSQQTHLQKRLEEAKKEREANADKYLQYSLKIGDLQNDKAKTLREIEAQREAQKLAREKAQREQEAHGWLAALQPDKLREQAGKATKTEQEAVTAEAEAKNAPYLYKEKVNTEKNRGKAAAASAEASRASASNHYASARAHDRSNNDEFSAWDENGREHKFRTAAAAEAFAKQNGTFEGTDVTSTSTTDSDTNGKPTTTYKKKSGYAKRVERQPATKPAPRPQQGSSYENTKALGL